MTSFANFTFVLIPVDNSESFLEVIKSTEGGLENDEAQKYAKSRLAIDMVNIISLSLPTPAGGYIGVSMYSDGDGKDKGLSLNSRATDIARACGHTSIEIHGDVVISRYYDNEDEEWARRDISVAEMDLSSEWIVRAANQNKGKSMGSYTTGGSLQNFLSQQQQQQQSMGGMGQTGAMGGGGVSAIGAGSGSSSNSEGVSGSVRWAQTGDDMEVRILVPSHTKGKDVKIKFSRDTLCVICPEHTSTPSDSDSGDCGKRITSGSAVKLAGSIMPDDSTWTLDSEGGDKFVVVTLAKSSPGVTWNGLLEDV